MTHDDYRQIRSMYADVDELCQQVEGADSSATSEKGLRRLLELFHDQQRQPEQIRSFARHLGLPDEVIEQVLEQGVRRDDAADETGIA